MGNEMLTFNANGYSDDELKVVVALANAVKSRADAVEKGAKAVLESRLEDGANPVTLDGVKVASLTRTKPGKGRWEVKDKEAFGAWLATHEGFEDFVKTVNVPTDDALDPGFLEPLIAKFSGGEIPDGVRYRKPVAATVKISMEKGAEDTLFASPAPVERLLGLEDRQVIEAEQTEADKPTENDKPGKPTEADKPDLFAQLGL